MALNQNRRIYWAIQAAGFAPDGSTTFTPIHGVQSVGSTTTFNLTQVYELGQVSLYENYEGTPDVEITIEKVIDGYPLIYHLATPTAAGTSLASRSTDKATFGLSIFGDTNNSASGTPNAQMTCSGLFVSSLSYTFPVDGECRESVTLVGSNKTWHTGASGYTFTGSIFDNTDVPASGVSLRQHVVFGSGTGASKLPGSGLGGIPNIASDGYNNLRADGSKYNASVQNITVSTDLNREALLELGRKNPFFRFANLPVEVTCEIEVLTSDGDLVEATEGGAAGNNGNNLGNKTILINLQNGLKLDLGTKNKLTNVTYGGGDAGGGNSTVTYSYSNFNDLTVTDPNDPSPF